MGAFITTTADQVKGMNNLPGVPYGVTFEGPSIGVAEDATFYVATTGSDSNDGLSSATAWATLQRAFNAIPQGYNANLVIQLGAGTFESAIIPVAVGPSAAIAVVGDRSSGDVIAPTFTFATNSAATATIAALGDFGRGERWAEPSTLPSPDHGGSKAFAGIVVDNLTGTTLTAVMGAESAGDATVALHAYATTISGGLPVFGTYQENVNLQLFGLSFPDTGVDEIRGCNGCGSKIVGSGQSVEMHGTGGMWSTVDGTGNVFLYVSSSNVLNGNTSLSGIFAHTIFAPNGKITVTTATIAPGALQPAVSAIIGGHVDVTYVEIEDGSGFSASNGSRLSVLDFANFDAACSQGFLATNNSQITVGTNITGSVTGKGAEAQSGSRIDGAVAAALTAGGTDLTAGTVTGLYGGGAIVDAGVALSAIT